MNKSIIHENYLKNIEIKRNDIFSPYSLHLLNRKADNLHPLEQLDILNNQVKDLINFPLIVVGGQAIAYWIWKYQKAFNYNVFSNKKLFSYDIDYVASKENLKQLSEIWNIQLQMNDHGQPPSIGIMLAKDKYNKIKEYKGLKFYNEEIDMPNIIDFIFSPAGFDYNIIKKLPEKYFLKYFDSDSSSIFILSPLGCLKSRLANIYQNIKRSTIFLEIERVHSLNVTFIAFQLEILDSGNINKFYKVFSDYRNEIMNSEISKCDAKYDLNLIKPFEYFMENSKILEGKINERFVDGFLYHSHQSYLKLYKHKSNILKRNK